MPPNDRGLLEDALVGELADLERQIGELQLQRAALQQVLLRVRRENASLRDVTRKNSLDRILIENRILEALKAAANPIPVRQLYVAARGVNPHLRSSTFRSHLHRLKQKGSIVSSRTRGHWMIARGAKER